MDTHETDGHLPPDRRIALLIDADNVPAGKIALILAELSKYGTAHIRRAYGDWTQPALKGWADKVHEFAIRPVQQFSYTKGKNATDIALVIDAMDMLYTQKPGAFCIASSDADFTPLVMHLKAAGREVYGFGERKAPMPFVNACTTFLYLDEVASEAAAPAKAPSQHVKAPASSNEKSLAGDTKLVTVLRGAVEATACEDGWAPLGAAGNAVKRQAPIDPRNYGLKNFVALFEATGLFAIVKGPSGQSYIADKRNKDRSAQPNG
jgi:uncharacterized LabA/DUF88 family protein